MRSRGILPLISVGPWFHANCLKHPYREKYAYIFIFFMKHWEFPLSHLLLKKWILQWELPQLPEKFPNFFFVEISLFKYICWTRNAGLYLHKGVYILTTVFVKLYFILFIISLIYFYYLLVSCYPYSDLSGKGFSITKDYRDDLKTFLTHF